MENLMSTFSERQGELVQLLLEHVQISMIALFVAILLAVPFAIFVVKYKKASELTLQLAGIYRLSRRWPCWGSLFLSWESARCRPSWPWSSTACFPFCRTPLRACRASTPSFRKRRSFGMSRMEKLKKFELVLAMPSIIGGIRTSSVMLIGTATLGA